MDKHGAAASYLKTNRDTWDKRTAIHTASRFYDVDGFLAGKSSLQAIERDILGEVDGKSLLHLQCHFGLDTLSWARLGAKVTGVDFSSAAINAAKKLARQSGLEAEFLCHDVLSLADQMRSEFDIVFSSYGVLCWLPELHSWAQNVARCLRPGGRFLLVEFHPVYDIFAGYPYFHCPEPVVETETTYTENAGDETATVACWSYPMATVISALLEQNLRLLDAQEYPYSPYDCFEGMEERQPGQFFLQHKGQDLPLLYSLLWEKPMQ